MRSPTANNCFEVLIPRVLLDGILGDAQNLPKSLKTTANGGDRHGWGCEADPEKGNPSSQSRECVLTDLR